MPSGYCTCIPGSHKRGERCPLGHSTTPGQQSGYSRPGKLQEKEGKRTNNKKAKTTNYAVPGRNLTYAAPEVGSTTALTLLRDATVEHEGEIVTLAQLDLKLEQLAEEISHSNTNSMVAKSTEGDCSIGTREKVLDQLPPMKRGRFEGSGGKMQEGYRHETSHASLSVTKTEASDTVTRPSRYKELCDSLAESLNRLEKENNKQLSVHMFALYKLLADIELSLST